MPIMLKNVRGSYPNVHVPRGFAESEPKYSISLLLPKGSSLEKEIRAEVKRVAEEKWGAKAKGIVEKQDAHSMRALLKNGDEENDNGEQKAEGHWLLKASNKARPLVIDRKRRELDEDSGLPYGGCYCNIKIDIWAQDNQFGKFLNCRLLGVQFWADGDAFGAAPTKADEFDMAEDDDDDAGDWG
jgi:hypothetical protein